MDEDLKQFLISLYESTRIQQETIFGLQVSVGAMRNALAEYEHFDERYAHHHAAEAQGTLAQKNSAVLSLIDAVIEGLKKAN